MTFVLYIEKAIGDNLEIEGSIA